MQGIKIINVQVGMGYFYAEFERSDSATSFTFFRVQLELSKSFLQVGDEKTPYVDENIVHGWLNAALSSTYPHPLTAQRLIDYATGWAEGYRLAEIRAVNGLGAYVSDSMHQLTPVTQ